MSFTRFHYDEARTTKNLQQATDPGRYMLDVPGVQGGDNLPYVNDPHWRLTNWGANVQTSVGRDGHPIDINSDLRGLTRNTNKDCFKNHYPNTAVQTTQQQYPTIGGLTDETRATHPAWLYRDLEQTRWIPLQLDPQENTCIPFHNNISSRIVEKDNYLFNGKC